MASFSSDNFEPQYAEKDNQTKTRTIGLEIEGRALDDEEHPFAHEMIHGNYANIDEDYDNYDRTVEDIKMDYIPEAGGLGRDGDGIEVALQPDSISLYKQGGSKRFKEIVKFLAENLNAKTSFNSGTHINISFLENEDTKRTYDNAYWLILNFATQIQKIAGRISSWAKILPYAGEKQANIILEELPYTKKRLVKATKPEGVKTPNIDRYAKHNCIVNKADKLIEFRLFKASTTIKELLAWVELAYNITEIAAHGEIKETKFYDLIQGEYINNYAKKLTGERKLTREELEASTATQFEFRMMSAETSTIIL